MSELDKAMASFLGSIGVGEKGQLRTMYLDEVFELRSQGLSDEEIDKFLAEKIKQESPEEVKEIFKSVPSRETADRIHRLNNEMTYEEVFKIIDETENLDRSEVSEDDLERLRKIGTELRSNKSRTHKEAEERQKAKEDVRPSVLLSFIEAIMAVTGIGWLWVYTFGPRPKVSTRRKVRRAASKSSSFIKAVVSAILIWWFLLYTLIALDFIYIDYGYDEAGLLSWIILPPIAGIAVTLWVRAFILRGK